MIYLAADHGGFKLKGLAKKFLRDRSFDLADLGPDRLDEADDYPDYAAKVAAAVAESPDEHIGILCCRSGQGMCVAANKFRGIRAVSAWTPRLAHATRSDDHANVLCLAADYLPTALALHLVDVFVRTPFSNAARHRRRVGKVAKLERR